MAKRKTIAVEEVIAFVNGILKNSQADRVGQREGAMIVLEEILYSTGNYKGYRYLLEDEVQNGLPGVNYEVNANGHFVPCADYEKRFFNTDGTRRQY